MKYATLAAIEKVLKRDIEQKKQDYKKVAEKENHLRQIIDDGKEYDPVEYDYWKESKKRHFETLCNAEEALRDFLSQDF